MSKMNPANSVPGDRVAAALIRGVPEEDDDEEDDEENEEKQGQDDEEGEEDEGEGYSV